MVVTDSLSRIVRVNHTINYITGYAETEAPVRDPNMLSSGRRLGNGRL